MNYRESAANIAAELGSDIEKGLTIESAHERIHSRGRNEVRVPRKMNAFVGIGRHIFSLMNMILLLMAVIHLVADGGRGWYLSLIFAACAVMNTVVGCIHFRRDSSPQRAVSDAQNGSIKVLRSGIEKEVPALLLAQGDVFFLSAGQTVPADAKIIECSGVVVDESILSGDGGSMVKSADGEDEEATVIYMGSRLIAGSLKAIVIAVGDNTQLGSTMGMVGVRDEGVSSLARKIRTIGNIFGTMSALVWLAALLLRLAGGYGVISAFDNSISAAIAVLPLTLPALVLMTTSIDVIRLRKRGIGLRSTSTVETMGAATLLCVGKRGTLTEHGFGVGAIRPGSGFDEGKLRLLAAMCTTADVSGDVPVGDPMQVALIEDALANGCTIDEIRKNVPVEQVLDNHRERRLMTTVHRTERGHVVICKGAPDAVAACCNKIYDNGVRPFDGAKDLALVISESNRMAAEALSVIAVAYRETVYEPGMDGEPPEKDMVFAGLIGLSNAVRSDTVSSVKQLRGMGVRTALITNENLTTATAVARQSGIPVDFVDQGSGVDCENIPSLRRTTVFADISAKQKADIVAAMNAEKENVVVVGRGVRDINAMNSGDISIATDAGAKICSAAADVRISGSGMGRIAEAIRECKRSFINIDRMIGFLLACNVAQAICVIVSLAAGYSAPFSPVGIIWLELFISAVAAVGIWCEPYHREPVPKTELNSMKSGKLSLSVIRGSIVRGILLGIAAMAVYGTYSGKIDIYQRRGAVVLILCAGFTFMAQSCRSSELFFKRFLKNPAALICLALNIGVCALTVGLGSVRGMLGADIPEAGIVAVCIAAGIIPALLSEGAKLFGRKPKKKKRQARPAERTNNE